MNLIVTVGELNTYKFLVVLYVSDWEITIFTGIWTPVQLFFGWQTSLTMAARATESNNSFMYVHIFRQYATI